MLDSITLLKLVALGCFGIITTAIASFLRWIEEESYNNEDEPDTHNCPFRSNGKECDWITDSDGLTTTEDTKINEQACEETCEENPSAFHETCTISNEPESKTDIGLVTMRRFHEVHTSAKQTPPIDELVNLAQQCLSSHRCKGNIRCHTGIISGDLTIDISLKFSNLKSS